jgi:GNAT superfamily N-acetyltransferase
MSCSNKSMGGSHMTDMLVKLYALPDSSITMENMNRQGIVIRRVMAYEYTVFIDWVKTHFTGQWADESRLAFCRQPIGCFIALEKNRICGFAAVNCTYLNFFGPIGVSVEYRGRGIGHALVLSGLSGLKSQGYAYAIIGGVADPRFFKKTAAACIIDGSSPGAYYPSITL